VRHSDPGAGSLYRATGDERHVRLAAMFNEDVVMDGILPGAFSA
jgi:hypothetical protein